VKSVYVLLAVLVVVLLALARRGMWRRSKHGHTSAEEARRMADEADESGMRRDLEGLADSYDELDER